MPDLHAPTSSAASALVTAERERSARRARAAARRSRTVESLGILLPFALVLIVGLVYVPNFTSASNITNMLVNGAILAITGFGMTLVIAIRGIDLSVGSMQALVVCVAAVCVNAAGPVAGVAAGLAIAAALGLVNGLLVTRLRIPAFVATLSTMGIFRGGALLFTGGAPILISSAAYKSFGVGSVAGVPLPFLTAVAIGTGMWFLLGRTRFGNHAIAVGGNPEAAVDTGISVHRLTLVAYVIAGLCAGTAGILLSSQLGIVNASLSGGLELQAIAIVVLGGTSMAGGRANIPGTFVAALLLAMINSGLNLLNIPSFYQYVTLGVLLIFALSFDRVQTLLTRRAREAGRS